MGVTIFAGEKRIGDIAKRVFGDLPPAQLKLAEQALLNANPQLKTLKALTPGAIVFVPQVPGLKPKPAASAGEHPAAAAVTLVARKLEQYQGQLAEAVKADRLEVRKTIEQLKSAELKQLASNANLDAQIAAVDQANKARDASAKEAESFVKNTAAQMQQDLKDLIDKLR
jgi:hypothetical protein